MIELQLDCKIKIFRSDLRGGFQALTDFFTKTGIVHLISCLHTYKQNGLAERKDRQIILAKASLPLEFWDECFYSLVFVIKKLSIPLLNFLSPLKTLFDVKPNFEFLSF